ncbi:hypothetical protein BZG36_00933 [Bifiguratus adelaidae]|uniref:AN1-type domain-containing protein n=1 Tax=Bifiguratus adelaidae TaxID=1938954 RepID=A0A261Y5I4_9FUNG|nr:hypothetical protein BZG36_00933 [Bifiguratus adelaidae]
MELDIGAHCERQDCKALDFLPFKCPYCHLSFCLDHRLPSDHYCAFSEQAKRSVVRCDQCGNILLHNHKDGLSNDQLLKYHQQSGCKAHVWAPSSHKRVDVKPCQQPQCGHVDKVVGSILCKGCRRNFCLKHRQPFAHSCPSLNNDPKQQRREQAISLISRTLGKDMSAPQRAGPSTAKPKMTIKEMLEKAKTRAEPTVKPNGTVPEPRTSWFSAVRPGSQTKNVMLLKRHAVGEDKIPLERRVYIQVHFPPESSVPPKAMFFDKTWAVGRVLDKIAEAGKIKNTNNVGGNGERKVLILRIHPDGPELSNSNRVQGILETGDELAIEQRIIGNTG